MKISKIIIILQKLTTTSNCFQSLTTMIISIQINNSLDQNIEKEKNNTINNDKNENNDMILTFEKKKLLKLLIIMNVIMILTLSKRMVLIVIIHNKKKFQQKIKIFIKVFGKKKKQNAQENVELLLREKIK